MQWALAGGRPADSNASNASVKKSEPPKFPDVHGAYQGRDAGDRVTNFLAGK
jgi:hypothetical protein